MITITQTPEGLTLEGAEQIELFSRELLEGEHGNELEVDGETVTLRCLNGTWTYRCPALSLPRSAPGPVMMGLPRTEPTEVVTGYFISFERVTDA